MEFVRVVKLTRTDPRRRWYIFAFIPTITWSVDFLRAKSKLKKKKKSQIGDGHQPATGGVHFFHFGLHITERCLQICRRVPGFQIRRWFRRYLDHFSAVRLPTDYFPGFLFIYVVVSEFTVQKGSLLPSLRSFAFHWLWKFGKFIMPHLSKP